MNQKKKSLPVFARPGAFAKSVCHFKGRRRRLAWESAAGQEHMPETVTVLHASGHCSSEVLFVTGNPHGWAFYQLPVALRTAPAQEC